MENLLNPNIECTDPDTLQFCLHFSNKNFWYCQPNDCHKNLFFKAKTIERWLFEYFCVNPKSLISLSSVIIEIKEFVSNSQLWYAGDISIDDINMEDQLELLNTYGYSWNSFSSDVERNQIICECYFETYNLDFTNNLW